MSLYDRLDHDGLDRHCDIFAAKIRAAIRRGGENDTTRGLESDLADIRSRVAKLGADENNFHALAQGGEYAHEQNRRRIAHDLSNLDNRLFLYSQLLEARGV